METKVCIKCGVEKNLNFFNKNISYKDGYRNVCKECMCGHTPIKRYTKNSENILEKECNTCKEILPISSFEILKVKGKVYYQSSCRACRNIHNSVKRKESNSYWKRDLRLKYGIEEEDFIKMITEQDNKCVICGSIFEIAKTSCVDHCHTTGKVRGILCTRCNLGLGLFKENIEALEEAINYIKKHSV